MATPVSTVLRHLGRGGERVVVAQATEYGALSAAAVAFGLAGASAATYWAGGTSTAMPHFFYVPVVLAANRFRHSGALAASLCAGLLAGPLMPLNVAAGTSQEPLGWLIRLAFFVLIGQIVALLCHGSLGPLSSSVADRRVSAELEQALERDEFRVVYQPLVQLMTGSVIGFEALIRWQHPRRGTVTPDAFIGAAERSGAIVPIGLYVLRQAVDQLRQWRALVGASDLKMAVNISARQLEDEELAAHVASILREAGLPASALQLEITETALITDLARATERLQQLRQLGVAIAIDDFGTGQSSLAYLHRFQADIVKIDRSFVAVLEHDDQARAVAQGVIRLAEIMGATTVAEGIETEAHADILRALGCRVGQGYHYARPSDPARMEGFLLSSVAVAA